MCSWTCTALSSSGGEARISSSGSHKAGGLCCQPAGPRLRLPPQTKGLVQEQGWAGSTPQSLWSSSKDGDAVACTATPKWYSCFPAAVLVRDPQPHHLDVKPGLQMISRSPGRTGWRICPSGQRPLLP